MPNPLLMAIVLPMTAPTSSCNHALLEQTIGHRFINRPLLHQALTHPSFVHEAEQLGSCDYQRLEFLGDAILGMLLAEILFNRHPGWSEGELSRFRSRLAGQDVLADRARALNLGDFILFGKGEQLSAGRNKDSILADVVEAVLAAVYLDAGLEAARCMVSRLFNGLVDDPAALTLARDSKSELQELLAGQGKSQPAYELLNESGPPHNRLFGFAVVVDGETIGEGEGASKKAAQQQAAFDALQRLAPHGDRV